MTKVIKEIIIMLLVCLVAMLALAIALYQYIPGKKVVPEISEYKASEQVQDLLEDNIDQKNDKDRVILTYEVTKGELSGYQVTNDYVPGKSNPFGEVSKTIEEPENTNSTETNSTDNQNSTSNSTAENNTTQNTTKVEPSNPSVYNESGKK